MTKPANIIVIESKPPRERTKADLKALSEWRSSRAAEFAATVKRVMEKL